VLYGRGGLWCITGDMRILAGDRYLIWRFKHGSAEAFERIYERHKTGLLKLAVVLIGDVHAAEDVVHDVFVHVARTRANLRAAIRRVPRTRARVGSPSLR